MMSVVYGLMVIHIEEALSSEKIPGLGKENAVH